MLLLLTKTIVIHILFLINLTWVSPMDINIVNTMRIVCRTTQAIGSVITTLCTYCFTIAPLHADNYAPMCLTGPLHGQSFACACRTLTNRIAARKVDNLQRAR